MGKPCWYNWCICLPTICNKCFVKSYYLRFCKVLNLSKKCLHAFLAGKLYQIMSTLFTHKVLYINSISTCAETQLDSFTIVSWQHIIIPTLALFIGFGPPLENWFGQHRESYFFTISKVVNVSIPWCWKVTSNKIFPIILKPTSALTLSPFMFKHIIEHIIVHFHSCRFVWISMFWPQMLQKS